MNLFSGVGKAANSALSASTVNDAANNPFSVATSPNQNDPLVLFQIYALSGALELDLDVAPHQTNTPSNIVKQSSIAIIVRVPHGTKCSNFIASHV